MAFPIYIAAILLFTLAGVAPVSVDYPLYKGCFNSSYALSSGYRTHFNICFTPQMCFSLCDVKSTMYAAFSVSDADCFCGNDIPKISAPLNSSLCNPCEDNPERMCGGLWGAISLYRISDHKGALLLATDGGIKKLVPSDSTTGQGYWNVSAMKFPWKHTVRNIAYDFKRQTIYFSSDDKVLRSSYIPVLREYNPPSTVFDKGYTINGLSVDWVNSVIYLSCYYNIYNVFTLLEDKDDMILFNWDKIQNMVNDPYHEPEMFLFYTQPNLTIFNPSTRSIVSNDLVGKYHLIQINSTAVDILNERVYVIGSYEKYGDWYITSIDYQGKMFRVHYQGPELSNPVTLDVFDDQFTWVNYHNNTYSVYVSKLTQIEGLKNITKVYQSHEKINDISIYRQEVQNPSWKRKCEKRQCSHECVPLSRTNVFCKCPENLTLDTDDRTCIENSETPESTFF